MSRSKAKPTLADVARKAGVSTMTVSNVVNGHSELVRQETRDRVTKAIRALGYRPHIHARALRLSRSWTVGMMITARLSDFPAAPWLSKMLAGLSNHLNEHGYGLLLHNQNPQEIDQSTLLKWGRTDGLIVMVSGSNARRRQILDRLSRLNQPVVALQEPNAPHPKQDIAVVRQDDFGGGLMLGDHLVARGAKRLVFIKPASEWPAMRERIRGLSSAIQRSPKASLTSIQCHDESYAAVEASVLKELKEHGLPDAFVGTNEAIALATLNILEARGYSISNDVLLAGFNASELWFFAKRKITTIRFPPYDIGTQAADMMLSRLETGRFPRAFKVLPAELIVGDTTVNRSPKSALVK
jgi:LacI family transcriptional regulator